MAITDISNNNTNIDFRKNYDHIRSIPFALPLDIEEKIKLLMSKLSLDYGAIDLILDQNDSLYFLEVNPYGQLEMVSAPCNYNIEKEIADILISYER